jgi:hypothetical protein
MRICSLLAKSDKMGNHGPTDRPGFAEDFPMAFQDFWMNVRKAARFMPFRPVVDAPKPDAKAIEKGLRGQIGWLTLQTVAGFNEADFGFLPEADLARLAQGVKEFRAIASRIHPVNPPTDKQVNEAIPPLREIIQILEFHRYEGADALRLGKRIEQALEPYWPPELAQLRFKTGNDHTGAPGIWIWAILTKPASSSDDLFLANVRPIRHLLDVVARDVVGTERWPFLSFRLRAEKVEMVETS